MEKEGEGAWGHQLGYQEEEEGGGAAIVWLQQTVEYRRRCRRQ